MSHNAAQMLVKSCGTSGRKRPYLTILRVLGARCDRRVPNKIRDNLARVARNVEKVHRVRQRGRVFAETSCSLIPNPASSSRNVFQIGAGLRVIKRLDCSILCEIGRASCRESEYREGEASW